ncbi:Thioredoxin domain-containing protein 16 [Bagarius yarrelli]|uniref:Thioredoxin domain-containing protein 16 n=1 Tax=Bagarius yarrelli TaxID=175774 RepID=A0A556TUT9_BAGYA|nr:Thioredoxin domain-containing protein 16 [Bagarius yarrelli]
MPNVQNELNIRMVVRAPTSAIARMWVVRVPECGLCECPNVRCASARMWVVRVPECALCECPNPELTVENFPSYLELRKPLLIMFVGGEESPETLQSLEELRKAESTGRLESSLPCWIHLDRTPAGRAVLETYLGYVPPLPALVLSQLSSGGAVYHFPSERPLLSENIIAWLQRIENHQEEVAGELP